jgi:hypothetical protein
MITLLSADDIGNDVLLVRAIVDDDLDPTEARGWVSALTNHYDPDAYGEDGHRLADAKPRHLSDAEARAYCEQLVRDARGIAPKGTPVTRVVDAKAATAKLAEIEGRRGPLGQDDEDRA